MKLDETPQEKQARLDAANRYGAYQRGWVHGATTRIRDPLFDEHVDEGIREAYRLGVSDGDARRRADLECAARYYGHEPSILRTQESTT